MNKLTLLLCLVFVGCAHKSSEHHMLPVLSDRNIVPLSNAPSNASIIGNMDVVSALFGIKASNVRVYIKTAENESWSEIQPLQKDQPTFVYNADMGQLRFQWCEEGCGYAILLVN